MYHFLYWMYDPLKKVSFLSIHTLKSHKIYLAHTFVNTKQHSVEEVGYNFVFLLHGGLDRRGGPSLCHDHLLRGRPRSCLGGNSWWRWSKQLPARKKINKNSENCLLICHIYWEINFVLEYSGCQIILCKIKEMVKWE